MLKRLWLFHPPQAAGDPGHRPSARGIGEARHHAPATGRGGQGMVASVSILIVSLLTVLATGLIAVAFREARIGSSEQTYVQSLYNADAGLEEAKMRLSPTAPAAVQITPVANTAWRAYLLSGHTQAEIQAGLDPTYGKSAASGYTQSESTANYVFLNTVQAAGAISWGWARIAHKVNGAGQIVYLNSVDGTETAASSQTVNGQPVNNSPILQVTVRGVAGVNQREVRLELQPIVQTTTTQTQTTTTVVTDPFGDAAHGSTSLTLSGNAVTDSYNSTNGAYNVNGNKFSNGDVSTDGTAAQTIALSGNAIVNGNAAVGPGANVSSAIHTSGNAVIAGTQSAESSAWNVPLSTIPAGIANQGALSISGNTTMNLPQGVYWFSSISVSGNAKINATGPVKIYVTGNISLSGNGVQTASNNPPNTLIYGTVDPNNANNKCTSVTIDGNASFYGAIYAPAADVTINGASGAAIYGALTAKTVTLNSAAVHWDQALQNIGQITSTVVTTTNTTTYTTTGFKRYLWSESLL